MQNDYHAISPKEFMLRISEGKRGLSGIRLTSPDLTVEREAYRRLSSYLREKLPDLRKNPVNLSNSHLSRLKAPEICLPFLIANDTNLESAYLRNANLAHANLGNVSLKNAHLRNANLENANLGNANLESANLRDANLRNAYLWYADLKYANLEDADLRNANLGYADLRNANLWHADLGAASLGYADLGSANLGHTDLRGVRNLETALSLEKAKFSHTKVTDKERRMIEAASKKKVLLDIV